MTTSPMQVAEGLVKVIRSVASDDGYKVFNSVFDEVPALKKQLQSKDAELEDLRAKITSNESTQGSREHKNLDLYFEDRSKFEEEKTKLKEEISAHVANIKGKDDAAAKDGQAKDELSKKLGRVNKLLDEEKAKVAAANEDITKLQKRIKEGRAQLEDLKNRVTNEESQAAKLRGEVEELQSSSNKLKAIEGFTTKLNTYDYDQEDYKHKDAAVWIPRLSRVWKSARSLVETLFEKDLSEECLRDSGAWKDLRESQYIDGKIPLPQSNSAAAKQMRIAAMLAILARDIDYHVFQPTYLSDDVDETRKLLLRLAMADSKRESFCRSVLISIFRDDQARNAAKRVDRVVQDTSSCVRHLLSDAEYENFRVGLKRVVHQALQAWQFIRHTTERLEPLFVLTHFEDMEWQTLKFVGPAATPPSTDGTPPAAEADDALLMIFPRIYIIDDGEPDPMTPGMALMKYQAAAATEEIERATPPSPTSGRSGTKSRVSRSARRHSVALNGGGSFLPQSTPVNAH